jgi:two-component sensor histidine kinase
MKVVMVDHSQADRKRCRILLEEALGEHLEFREASGAAEGMGLGSENAPDCILLDYNLPDMSGIEFLAQLRKNVRLGLPHLAVVMLTGLSNERVAVDAIKAGAQDCLPKGRITASGLLSAIAKAREKTELVYALRAERDRLARLVEEKESLLNEVHHRVKNNLQVIASMLRLQSDASHEPAVVEALRQSQNRVESMALIHEQLYENHDLRHVDLAKHAELLLTNLFQSYGVDPRQISGVVKMSSLPMGVDRAIPAGLILTELISNAIKHAFPDGRKGSIQVVGGHKGDHIEVAVRDTGIGIPEGVVPKRQGSLGLEIVHILTRQLKGAFELDRTNGTRFRLSFPETKIDSYAAVQSASA